MNKRVCLYARTALNEETALEKQRFILNRYAGKHNLTVVDIISESSSGLNGNREGIKRLRKMADEHRIDAIVIVEISRLFRNVMLTVDFAKSMKECGVDIIETDGNRNVDFLTKI